MTTARTNEVAMIAPLWTVQDVSDFLRVPVQTIYSWRSHGDGPPALRIGRYLRYRPEDVRRWLDERSAA